jgi:hypothetical protein
MAILVDYGCDVIIEISMEEALELSEQLGDCIVYDCMDDVPQKYLDGVNCRERQLHEEVCDNEDCLQTYCKSHPKNPTNNGNKYSEAEINETINNKTKDEELYESLTNKFIESLMNKYTVSDSLKNFVKNNIKFLENEIEKYNLHRGVEEPVADKKFKYNIDDIINDLNTVQRLDKLGSENLNNKVFPVFLYSKLVEVQNNIIINLRQINANGLPTVKNTIDEYDVTINSKLTEIVKLCIKGKNETYNTESWGLFIKLKLFIEIDILQTRIIELIMRQLTFTNPEVYNELKAKTWLRDLAINPFIKKD